MGDAKARFRAAFVLCALSCVPATAVLAQPQSVQPGVTERGEERQTPPKASKKLVIPELSTPPSDSSFDSIKLVLRDIDLQGNAAIDAPTLIAFFAPLIGREVSLAQIFQTTQAITKLYADSGYALCLAFLPAQDIENGVVKVQVVEGYVETVEIQADDRKLARVLSEYGEKLKDSRPLRTSVLERYLLLANELPGVRGRSVVDRGSGAPGATKLIIKAERNLWDGDVTVDNRGTRAVGPERVRVNLAANGLMSGRERLTVSYLRGIDDNELDYLAGTLALALNAEGTVLSIDGSNSNSQPGTADLSAINFETRGLVLGARLFHPLIRARAENLFLELGFIHKDLQGDILGLPNSDDRLSLLSLSAHYDFLDDGGAVSAIDLTGTYGLDLFDATSKSDPFPSRAGADATFTRIELSASRNQPLIDALSLYASATAQYADAALLSSEQCGLGGARYGRAFDAFEVAGDHCAMAQLELRYQLELFTDALDYIQLFAFGDAGWVQRRGPILPGEFKEADRQSVGAGVRFGLLGHVDASVEYADPLGNPVALEGDDGGRVFFSLSVHR